MSQLKTFLLDASKDQQLLQQFRMDPQGVTRKAGLSDEEREALLSGDPTRIRKMLGDESNAIIVVFIHS
ncbi:MAG TPA: hypothetical protein VGV61_12750 [Thermoanaerobaculia bacterium]|jgi:hypothetical protein|nr:hypothetical protein [Thermoanaerobaculia bacterium]